MFFALCTGNKHEDDAFVKLSALHLYLPTFDHIYFQTSVSISSGCGVSVSCPHLAH